MNERSDSPYLFPYLKEPDAVTTSTLRLNWSAAFSLLPLKCEWSYYKRIEIHRKQNMILGFIQKHV